MAISRDVRLGPNFAVQPEIRLREEVPQSTGSAECRVDVPRGVGGDGRSHHVHRQRADDRIRGIRDLDERSHEGLRYRHRMGEGRKGVFGGRLGQT